MLPGVRGVLLRRVIGNGRLWKNMWRRGSADCCHTDGAGCRKPPAEIAWGSLFDQQRCGWPQGRRSMSGRCADMRLHDALLHCCVIDRVRHNGIVESEIISSAICPLAAMSAIMNDRVLVSPWWFGIQSEGPGFRSGPQSGGHVWPHLRGRKRRRPLYCKVVALLRSGGAGGGGLNAVLGDVASVWCRLSGSAIFQISPCPNGHHTRIVVLPLQMWRFSLGADMRSVILKRCRLCNPGATGSCPKSSGACWGDAARDVAGVARGGRCWATRRRHWSAHKRIHRISCPICPHEQGPPAGRAMQCSISMCGALVCIVLGLAGFAWSAIHRTTTASTSRQYAICEAELDWSGPMGFQE